jgi:hypothetical protein
VSVKEQIAKCHAVVPIWTVGCYDRCGDPADAVRVEVETAVALGKHIVPFIDTTPGSSFFDSRYKLAPTAAAGMGEPPAPPLLPPTMDILGRVGVVYVHEYPDLWARKMHRLLQQW